MSTARLGVFLFTVALVACDESSGLTLFGTVGGFAQDASTGVTLAGVAVTVGERTAVSGNDGTFRLDQVVPGEYTLTASFGDFEPFHQAVIVHARQTTSVPILLVPAGFALLAPTAIAAEPGHNRGGITVSWTPLPEAVNYALYWSTSADVPPTSANRIGGVTNAFIHTQLQPGTTYYYAVAGIGLVAEGPPSAVVSSVPYEHIAIEIETPDVGATVTDEVTVSVRVGADDALASVTARLGGTSVDLEFVPDFFRWQGSIPVPSPAPEGIALLTITATDVLNRTAEANRILKYPN